MDRVEEIKVAISGLTPEESIRLSQWFRQRDDALWDRQLDDDSAVGKLDFLFEEAESQGEQALLTDWPPSSSPA